jgi:hypothetical protein
MGQAMACCGKSDIDSNDIKTNFLGLTAGDQLTHSPHFASLKASDRLVIVLKLQAAFRGYMARKRVRMIKDSLGY